jgi:hypothetical protein
MHFAQHLPESVEMQGNGDQMHMIGHQAPRSDPGLGLGGIDPEQIKIGGIIFVGEKHLLAPVAAWVTWSGISGMTNRAIRTVTGPCQIARNM